MYESTILKNIIAYNQIKFSQKDERYQLGYRIPWMDTMLDIAWDYKKRLLITEQSRDRLWLLEVIE